MLLLLLLLLLLDDDDPDFPLPPTNEGAYDAKRRSMQKKDWLVVLTGLTLPSKFSEDMMMRKRSEYLSNINLVC